MINEQVYIQLSFYTQPILLLFGTIGALINLVLFCRRRALRTASCSFYFRVLSINDLLVLYIIVLTQWFNDQFHFDPTRTSSWYCKFRTYATYCLYAVSPYCTVLVCMDRLFRTSRYGYLRKLATSRQAHRIVLITILFICSVYFHILFQYNIVQSVCVPSTLSYFRFLSHFLLIFYCLCPPILMTVFSSGTLVLLHYYQRKHQKTRVVQRNRKASTFRLYRNYQILKVLFLYVTCNILCTLPFAILILLHVYRNESSKQSTIYIKCSVLLCNLNHCTSFYIYTIGTPLYRRELLLLLRSTRKRLAEK